ncbi:MAG: M15 family metallopeptidase [Bacteroidota bacterium]
MQRRSFIQKSSTGVFALTTVPTIVIPGDPNPEYSIEELMGKGDIPLVGAGINLRKDAHDAFVAMKKAAFQAGFTIKIVSSYRSFDRQKVIWERKYRRYTEEQGLAPTAAIEKIIEYSTIPGTSRHHWATEVDIIDGNPTVSGDVLLADKFEKGGPFEGLKTWLDENAAKFDYHLVYTDSYFRKGFKYEPWHYSYAPLSIPMLTQFRKNNLAKLIRNEDFEGAEHFTAGFLKDYIHNNILDINPYLL